MSDVKEKGNPEILSDSHTLQVPGPLGSTVYVEVVSVCDSQLLRTRAATFLMWPHIFVLIMGQGT